MGQKQSRSSINPRDVPSNAARASLAPNPREAELRIEHSGLIRGGEPVVAADIALQAVHDNKTRLGSEHPTTLSSMFELGRAYHRDRRIEKALRVFEELLPLNEKIFGPTGTRTLVTLDAICEELCNLGKYELSLAHLIDLKERCERILGPEYEHTIRVLVDIGHMSKHLDKTQEASSAFSLALDRSKRGLGQRHDLTLAILNDLRGLKEPSPPNLGEMKALLRRNVLPVDTKPFSKSRSITFMDLYSGSKLAIMTSVGYEASNAMMLRIGPINGESAPKPPEHIPTYHADLNEVRLRHIPGDIHPGNSFEALINRSIDILPQYAPPTTLQAVDKHVAWLKSLKSLDDLLSSKENPVWFFQRKQSFLQQSRFQRWNPELLEQYVLVPVGGGFANAEDCLFVSHYWRTQPHPDPDGEDLRELQRLLSLGFWSKALFVWVDWTCLPQWERTAPQQQYFSQALLSIPKLVRDCSFIAHFPEFRPRLWVLFEVAAFTFNRADAVGLACTDTFQKHLLQMKGDGVRLVLDKYGYKCTNKSDREWVITSLEILLTLRKVVPSIDERRQILDAIDNAAVRTCVHEELGVEIDKKRGLIKANGTNFQFNPLPVVDGFPSSVSEARITGGYAARLKRALERADQCSGRAGISEIAREFDRSGDYKIAEIVHRRAVAASGAAVALEDLTINLERQERYQDAATICQQQIIRFGESTELLQKRVALQQSEARLVMFHKWKFQPLEASLRIGDETGRAEAVQEPALRNGLRRSWLQRLDMSVWQSEDPVAMKSMEEQSLEFEKEGNFLKAQDIHWSLLARRKQLLGPCHVDTRRSLTNFARVIRLRGKPEAAHIVYGIALAVCDFTLGPKNPESRAVLGDLAAAVLQQGQQGVARSYYRQQLERALAVVEWDDPETFPIKFFLKALAGNAELKIVQCEETTVQIMGLSPGSAKRGPPPSKNKLQKLDGPLVMLDLENADPLLQKFILAW
ncbi:hypothetical protein H072_4024 [Dactylellina haptotyla CBS 200.50]|uniref:Uncharacterized protein n=1 Tax=Dactylellina haptotyla (strain CBS 200.50) TaxID=1284197 RepID=S8AGJ2_DACHA|nr:hypothetical protein H072_4024 [Dactylellina haptotyla CBS 200.50]